MLKKKQVLKSISDLPESFSSEELIDRILLLQKIDIGIKQADSGQVHSSAAAKNKLKKWLK